VPDHAHDEEPVRRPALATWLVLAGAITGLMGVVAGFVFDVSAMPLTGLASLLVAVGCALLLVDALKRESAPSEQRRRRP
jgi:hypothetical protein